MRGGGQVRYVANLSEQLRSMGHDVTIGCKRGSLLETVGPRVGARVFNEFSFRGGGRINCWSKDCQAMMRLMRSGEFDIVHVNGSQDHWVAALANRLLGSRLPVIRTRHNTYPVARNLPNKLLNRSWTDFQIVVCDVVRKSLVAHPCFSPERLETIHNGVDVLEFSPHPELRMPVRLSFGFDSEHIVVGIVARLVPAKGHTFLFKAVKPLMKDFPFLRVLVLGEGALRGILEKEVDSLGIGSLVHFAGFREDMSRCVQALDIMVQPSIDCDTSSFSLKEGMAAGVPVIASDYGGLPEIVADGVEGYIVPAGTVEPLTAALKQLIMDPGLRRQMGVAARERVVRDFSIERFASATFNVYERVLRSRSAQPCGKGIA